jgi:hypothetical protein
MMRMADEIEIVVGDVNDIEARVQARYIGKATGVALSGTIRGPFCEKARTLPAEFKFHERDPTDSAVAEAIVPDPFTWSPEVPHVYRVEVTARQGERVLTEYRGEIGLRRSSAKRSP